MGKGALGAEAPTVVLHCVDTTITHKIITEPNFIIFELFSVIPVLRLPNRIVSRISKSWQ